MAISKQAYKRALLAQTACNLSGVVYSFAEAMEEICQASHEVLASTDWRNSHPISILYAAAIARITGAASLAEPEIYQRAYETCQELAE